MCQGDSGEFEMTATNQRWRRGMAA